jgi:peptidoglycan-associated lipoprotein
MKFSSHRLCLVLASVTLLIAGCAKKPTRPDPGLTVLGQQPGGPGYVMPTDVPITQEPGLVQRLGDGVIDDGNTIRGLLQPVYFDYDKSDIRQPERTKLQAAKEYLEQNPGSRLLLEGHCDWRGTAEYNLGLGDRRANAARRFVQSLGVTPERLETLSKGSLEAARSGDETSMSRDRRVELVIIKPKFAASGF